jgi:REP element-mobilizing transposase RayT
MAQTLVSLYIHVVFSTKSRVKIIPAEIERDLYAYIGGIVNNHSSKLIAANGTSNHAHLLISLGKTILIPELVGHIKRDSSKWLKSRSSMLAKFSWQDGYSVFSVGHLQLASVVKYIDDQKTHHKNKLFEDEMRGFYKKYDVAFDERYVWD